MPDPGKPTLAASTDRLVIVYNANAGWAAALMDAAHKLLRPETYECSLCMISYGAVSMRRPWRNYLDSLAMEKQFYHRQDFARAYPVDLFPMVDRLKLPAIFIEADGKLHGLLSSKQLHSLTDVEALIAALDLALSRFRK
ncbi:MAG: hypothetical protein GW808_14395 [Sphingomonadales bacterium]|nr:hypothetical protein [Sphingomonadales bacterium]PIX64170.1 MAG: hypothetical protein COZ43_12515 [Sphingomonadales bacterium CG_4_10_14_3_um_filter_58_15]NCO50382.1 hypothetical protein [Sphingomonadales bacterium]NCO98669.1 hypothetical protein [Sphingomonadales bacterium]NCP26756.1 hypothetical protein [Sphingomonadales bacterium]